ncbi:MAG: glycogen debranching enzyme N-terminal domain-containing protein [Victivallales bacterium]|jgi:predicted glycogen debranching enzyme|nr:glycogen debranching enzyme N-terminal domain-containing protein [Victivallales bacterium]
MRQNIHPERVIFYAGDTVTFTLDELKGRAGHAILRTTIGRAAVRRRELIEYNEKDVTPLGMEWHDIPMNAIADGSYSLTLPLVEVGVFEAKCCFIPSDRTAIEWPSGDNFRLKVEPAANVCGNTMYSAFVRQFGVNCEKSISEAYPEKLNTLDQAGYTVIPPSGTFRNLAVRLDHIFDELGCRILQLLPIHPAPTQYGRMGRYGSPFAALDYFNVDPALADFDLKATPMEQFGELVDQVHARGGRIFMDIPVNHTGWASKLQMEHPDYFVRQADGTFESPGAWGVIWADLCKLNYKEPQVHHLMAKVFLFWCRHRVDGFRCDAGYMLPIEAWEYIIPKVREEFPDTVFLLEGLGGPQKVQEKLLGNAGMNWGYSELFQNYSRDEISRYFPYVDQCSSRYGTLINFAETHDNARLAASGKTYAQLRFMVAAMLSKDGAFGFANGAEFYATEKIDVHGNAALNFGAKNNLIELIRKLNTLLAEHPAFQTHVRVALVQEGTGNCLAVLRSAPDGNTIFALLNLDCENPTTVSWKRGLVPDSGVELLTEKEVHFGRNGEFDTFELKPGGALCIGFDNYRITQNVGTREPERSRLQRAEAMAMKVQIKLAGLIAPKAGAGQKMLQNPEVFCAAATGMDLPPVTHYRIESDTTRHVMIPPGDILLVASLQKFRLAIFEDKQAILVEQSLKADDNRHFVLAVLPENPGNRGRALAIHLCCFNEKNGVIRKQGHLLQLPPGDRVKLQMRSNAAQIRTGELLAFSANNLGGVGMFRAAWGELYSKYEAILAGNVNPDYPVDRRVMFTRLRGWLVVNGYSQELNKDSILEFTSTAKNQARWVFMLPAGQGCRVRLEVEFEGAEFSDAVRFNFRRPTIECEVGVTNMLDDATPIRLILRPDLEDRINHQLTKAYSGPEKRFPEAMRESSSGFEFTPSDCTLEVKFDNGTFHHEPEWHYMVDLPFERYYGLEDKTDLFSPGYVDTNLLGGESFGLYAQIRKKGTAGVEVKYPARNKKTFTEECVPGELFEPTMRRFVVKRDNENTVIAGYPWFLDWGRDTLIALRGLVKGAFESEAAAIIRQFAAFERNGTIPNMIRGLDDRNRDTSDAPLYLIVATRDYADCHSSAILETRCGTRSLKAVLCSIVEGYRNGTPNGIHMDAESGLIFSPSHFTWMDTNFPAGTPREGYPIEIQALWYASLEFLGRTKPEYARLAQQVSASIEKLFFSLVNGVLFCSDCLHAKPGVAAHNAEPDDHNRPNQLLAVTLGAVKDPAKQRAILNSSEELLVPGGIRTLADRPVKFRLPVERDGKLLNNPAYPYQGYYRGAEDTSRKVAYHNGTVWCWPFPAYCEALYLLGGESVRQRALSLLLSSADYFENGVPGQLPEVADGDYPHRPGGCAAQAWSVSEFFRVYRILDK